ncbi:hypothetical protein ACHAXH_008815 [Discostella pseudostelligera]
MRSSSNLKRSSKTLLLAVVLILSSLPPPPLQSSSGFLPSRSLLFVDASPGPSYSRNYFEEDDNNNRFRSSSSDSGSGVDNEKNINGLSSLFDTQRPRDLIGGLRSAVSNTLRGTFYGVAAMFSNIPPVSSSMSSSNTSLSNRGIISGVITTIVTRIVIAIALPTAGLFVGVYQITRGVLATPSAIIDGFIKCKVYNESERTWVHYRLNEDVEEIRAQLEKTKRREEKGGRRTQDAASSSSSSPRKKVKSTEYYELLGIRTDASPSEIRSAYRRRARDVHPDKRPDDPNAMRKFRELSAAYQTLSDPALRKRYDSSGIGVDADGRGGGEAMSQVMLDPLVFFAVLFGSEQVEPYIGELGVATTFDTLIKLASSGALSTSYESWEELKYALGWSETALKQRKRQVDIATFLRSRVSDYVEGYLALEAFEESCRAEAVGIAEGGSYGATFLLAIGPSLIAEADAFLGYRSSVLGSWRGPVSNVKRNLLFLRRKFAVTKAIMRTIRESLTALYKSADLASVQDESIPPRRRSSSGTSSNDAKRKRPEQRVVFNDKKLLKDNLSNTIPAILELAWAINYVDITNTLHGACGKLFRDADLSSWEERLLRAEAVYILGSQFYLVGLEATAGWSGNATMTGDAEDIKARANAAFMESLKKGMEDHDDEM